jgi:transaldolase
VRRQIKDLAIRGVSVEASDDHHLRHPLGRRRAPRRLRLIAGFDGRVSIEVNPRLARKTDKTIAEAKQLW